VKLVMEQANKPEQAARAALVEAKGDIAEAILKLSQP
jgi:NACalpha-BTF3-like transcription factor